MPIIEFVNTRTSHYLSKWLTGHLMFFHKKIPVIVEPDANLRKMPGCVPLVNLKFTGKKLIADPVDVGFVDASFDQIFLVNEIDHERILVWTKLSDEPVRVTTNEQVTIHWWCGYVMEF